MRIYIRIVDQINRIAGYVAAFLMVPLMLITTYEVLMRYVIQRPTIWSWDLNIQLFAAIVMLGGADTLRRKGHVMMDVMVLKMPMKKRAILELFTYIIFLFGVGVLLWGGWDQGLASLKALERMPTVWAPPYYTMKMLIPIGAFLLLLQGAAECFRNILAIKSAPEGA